MSEFTLPSGRKVDIKEEPTYGDELKAVKVSLNQDAVEYLYAKYAVMCPSMAREEIDALSREDGHALAQEMNHRYEGRPVDSNSPFGSGSMSEPTPTLEP